MKTFRVIGIAFTAIGLIAVIISISQIMSTQQFKDDAVKANGVIVELIERTSTDSDGYTSTNQFPVIEYTTQAGQVVKFESSMSDNSASVGQSVEVLYLEEDPYEVVINNSFDIWFLVWFAGFFALIFGGMGVVFVWVGYKDAIRKYQSKDFRLTLDAEITEIAHNNSVKVNGRSPYIIHAQWHDKIENTIYSFKSKSFWYDPGSYISEKTIQVKVDDKNMKRYWMDTSFLPKQD